MARLLVMPAVSANVSSARLLNWLVGQGDSFRAGDPLAEIETDKATVELPAETAGVMGRQLVTAGSDIEVGAAIGVVVDHPGEAIDLDALLQETPSAESPRPDPPLAQPDGQRVFASPLARRIAREYKVDLGQVRPSGPGGRIVRMDVERLLADGRPTPQAADHVEVPLTNARRAIARRVTESKNTVPHFYVERDVHADRLLAIRREINTGRAKPVTVTDLLVRAAARALVAVPGANCTWHGDHLRRHRHADVAIAVATPDGVITPVIRQVELKSVAAISAEARDLADRARAGRLHPDEFAGGTFTISNLGMYGIDRFAAIINPPQPAILAVGSARPVPVVDDGQIGVATVLSCTLSVDHRVLDGAMAATWLSEFATLVENPLRLLVDDAPAEADR